MRHDRAIARLLERLFRRDVLIPSQRIRVSVQNGCVTIRGSVQSDQIRQQASEIARSLPGVHVVRNELQVVPAAVLPDAVVAENVRRALESESAVVKESITVSITDGVVTLAGTVRGYEERALALDIALSCEGVRAVEDKLLIDALRGIEDATLARRVKQAIVTAMSDREGRIRIAISGGRGVLSGWVRSVALKCCAEEVAREFSLRELKNEIQVTSEAG